MIEALSSPLDRRIAVDPRSLRFGHGCFVCAASEAIPTPVRFTRTLILGVLGGIESIHLVVPLCSSHGSRYRQVMHRITVVQGACALIAAVSFGLLFLSFETPALKPLGEVLAVVGIVAVVIAFIAIGQRARALPLRFRARQYGRLGSYGAYVFTFDDATAAARFAESNRGP